MAGKLAPRIVITLPELIEPVAVEPPDDIPVVIELPAVEEEELIDAEEEVFIEAEEADFELPLTA